MDSKNASLLQTALLLGAAYFVYRKFAGVGSAVADTASSVLDTINENIGDAIIKITGTPSFGVLDKFRVINGTVAHVTINTHGFYNVVRLWNWSTNKYQDAPGLQLPQGWENAPVPVAHFADVRAAGKPWFTPWDSSGIGLNATFSSTASGTVTGWFDNLFK